MRAAPPEVLVAAWARHRGQFFAAQGAVAKNLALSQQECYQRACWSFGKTQEAIQTYRVG